MEETNNRKHNKGGRPEKANPSIHRYVFRLTDEENARFLTLFEASGANNKAQYVTSLLFERTIKSVKIDASAMDYYTRLTALYGQFRGIAVNYNQIVRILHRNFSEKKAAAYLLKLEKHTAELSKLCGEMIQLTKEFEGKYLKNE